MNIANDSLVDLNSNYESIHIIRDEVFSYYYSTNKTIIPFSLA